MYLEHFGLNDPPFRITPVTEFFFSGANRGEILDALIYSICEVEGIVKVSGEVGSGKTMLCRMLLEKLHGHIETIYLANSMNSLRIEGQKTVGIEIVQQFDWEVPDVIIIPGGNLGNVSALGSGLLMMRDLGLITKLPRIVVAQAERANPLYRSYLKNFASFEPMEAQKTLASAIQIGDPVSYEKAIRTIKQFDGIVMDATEQELSDAAALGDRTGMFNCPHTGVALAAMIKLIKAGKIDKSEHVVVISTAHGLKFTDFKVNYHEEKLGFASQYANKPIEVAARFDAVKEALTNALKKRVAQNV